MLDLLILLVLNIAGDLLGFDSGLGTQQFRRTFALKHFFGFLLHKLQGFFLVVALLGSALEKGNFGRAVRIGRGGGQGLA